jgi:Xaa-Pro aminopeptidase
MKHDVELEMSVVAIESTDPVSSGEIPTSDPKQLNDISRKHQAVAELLESQGYDALLLQKPSSFAWFTSGADNSRSGSTETTAALFITSEARVVITSNVDSPQLFDHKLFGMGFQLKERCWHEPRRELLDDLCRGRNVASDTGLGPTADISAQLLGIRAPLTATECERYRKVGRFTAHAVEATGRHCRQGQSEAEIAGEVAHRLIKHGVVPERIQVWADGQASRYPRWSYGADRVEHHCVIAAVGRRWGLCAGVARTVCFGPTDPEFHEAHHRAMLVQATGIHFSRPEWEMYEIWDRIKRIYEKSGCSDAWQQSEQAEIIGYEMNEQPLVPKSEFRLSANTGMYWHPGVGPAVVGDSILVTNEGPEVVTSMEEWPRLKVKVKQTVMERPSLLCREA